MRHKNIIYLLLILFMFGCQSKSANKDVESASVKIPDDNDCPLLEYSESYEDSISIQTEYYQCDSDWKFGLRCLINEHVFYQAESLLEFEFNKSNLPRFKRLNNVSFQILLELNDRPAKNKCVVLTVQNERLIDEKIIPNFESDPKDYDNDGQLEFAGILDFVEGFDPDTTNYNPVLFFEELDRGIQLDSQTTILKNKEIWGDFHGFEMRRDIKLPNPIGLKKYLTN